jgi:hypothetical protein
MIIFDEIKVGDIIKVLVNMDDIEEELYAKVTYNSGTCLEVTYLVPTSKIYKGTTLYEFEEDHNLVESCNITEHYERNDLSDIMVKIPKTPYYYLIDEEHSIDESDSSSIVDSEDSDSDDSFIADDDEEGDPPPDAEEIDREWNQWNPTTPGAKRFKDTVDLIEYHARMHADNLKF